MAKAEWPKLELSDDNKRALKEFVDAVKTAYSDYAGTKDSPGDDDYDVDRTPAAPQRYISFDDADTEMGVLTELAGYSSRCWSGQDHGVFDDIASTQAVDAAARRLHQLKLRSPQLGYATTGQLLNELKTRIRVDSANGGGGLDYRTVGWE